MHTRRTRCLANCIRTREFDLARSQIKVDHNSRSECVLRTGNGLLSNDAERKDQCKSHPQHIIRNRRSGLEVRGPARLSRQHQTSEDGRNTLMAGHALATN